MEPNDEKAHMMGGLFDDYFEFGFTQNEKLLIETIGNNYSDGYSFIALIGLYLFLVQKIYIYFLLGKLDYKTGEMTFEAVPYTEKLSDTYALLQFFFATYQKYR